MNFFKANGICFGCVNKGHLSKHCRKRLNCEVCKLKHPTILHIVKKQIEDTAKDKVNTDKSAVSSTLVSLENSTGAGDDQTLSIVPVHVKLSNSDTCVQTYALRKLLHAKGRKTKILLKTLDQEKVTNIDMISQALRNMTS